MTSSHDWLLLPDLVFNDLMLIIGLQSLESLHRCRQVCKTWNDKITSNIWEHQTRKNILIVGIVKKWVKMSRYPEMCGPDMLPSDEDISNAKCLGKCKYT